VNRKFRLHSVKKVRLQQRDKASAAVSEIDRALQIFQQQMTDIRREIVDLIKDRKSQSTGPLMVTELIDIQRYELQLNLQLQAMREKLNILLEEKNRRDAALLAAQTNLKAIESLEEKHFEQLRIHDEKALQSRLDEWSATKSIASKMNRVLPEW
jgi:flagellar export protein FliJ